jgi:hypothetical protein
MYRRIIYLNCKENNKYYVFNREYLLKKLRMGRKTTVEMGNLSEIPTRTSLTRRRCCIMTHLESGYRYLPVPKLKISMCSLVFLLIVHDLFVSVICIPECCFIFYKFCVYCVLNQFVTCALNPQTKYRECVFLVSVYLHYLSL